MTAWLAGMLTLLQAAPVADSPAAGSPSPEVETDEIRTGSSDELSADSTAPTSWSLRTLAQLRYGTTRAISPLAAEPVTAEEQLGTIRAEDGWRLQRMFVRLTARPHKRLDSKLLVDLAELAANRPRRALKLALVELTVVPRLSLTAGMFKRPFSLLELLPIADFELAEVGVTDEFIKKQGFAGRDLGAMLRLSPLPRKRWLTIMAGAFAGNVEEGFDASPVKLLVARAETRPVRPLRLGLDGAWRTSGSVDWQRTGGGPLGAWSRIEELRGGRAVSADATVSVGPLELRLEALAGERTDRWRGTADTWMAGWALLAYRLPLGPIVLMPAVRAEYLDADREHSRGGRSQLSAALGCELDARTRLLIEIDRYAVQDDSVAVTRIPWKSGRYESYATDIDWARAIVQLQIKL